MSDTAVLLFALLAIPAGIVPLFLQRRSLRRNTVESRRLQLVSECFSGTRHVAVDPQQWRLPVADVRLLGAQRGYQETPPPAPGVVAFSYAPGAPTQPQGRTTTPARQRQERERLAHELAESGFSWGVLSEIGGTLADAAGFAAQHGAAIARSYGDQLDPVLLFGTRTITSVREVARHGASRSPTSTRRALLRNLVTAPAVILFVALTAAFAVTESAPLGWTLLGAGPVLIVAAITPFVSRAASADTTDRMTRLIREFDGRDRVHVIARHFRLSRLTFLDVAAELGYVYSSYWNSLRPTSRWYEGWTIFIPIGQSGGPG